MDVGYLSRQPMQELPAFQDQIDQTYSSTYIHYYKVPVMHPDTIDSMQPKAPQCDTVDYVESFSETLGRGPPRSTTSNWGRSSDVIGVHPMLVHRSMTSEMQEDALKNAQDTISRAMINTQALEAPMETEEPLPETSTQRFYHGPMPDRAIAQHFLHRRTTASIVDGSGQDQSVEVGLDDAEPNFYYLRDADGSRKVLEVVDRQGQAPLRAQGTETAELASEVRADKRTPALRHQGCRSHSAATHYDQSAEGDVIRRRAEQIAAARARGASAGGPGAGQGAVPDQKRITVPHFFQHVNGVPTTNRTVELKMRGVERDPNPPRACIATADKLIYSQALPPQRMEF